MKTKTLQVRLNEIEYERFLNIANEQNKTASDLTRVLVNNEISKYLDRKYTLLSERDFKEIESNSENNKSSKELADLFSNLVEVEDLTS